jgi:HK97 family phage prohead protease
MERFYLVSPIEKVDVRDSSANGNNTWTMSGYAAVFDQQTTAFDDGFERMTVEIAPEAFDQVLAEQAFDTPGGAVHFNLGHDMNTAVAATDVPEGQPGSLKLSKDGYGFRFLARVSRDDPDGIRLASKMRSGVVKQASFAFTVPQGGNQITTFETDESYEVNRRIVDINALYDVCACPQGLFSQTVSGLQQYAKLLGQPEAPGAGIVNPDLGGETFVSSEQEGEGATESAEKSEMVSGHEALEEIRTQTLYGGLLRR